MTDEECAGLRPGDRISAKSDPKVRVVTEVKPLVPGGRNWIRISSRPQGMYGDWYPPDEWVIVARTKRRSSGMVTPVRRVTARKELTPAEADARRAKLDLLEGAK